MCSLKYMYVKKKKKKKKRSSTNEPSFMRLSDLKFISFLTGCELIHFKDTCITL